MPAQGCKTSSDEIARPTRSVSTRYVLLTRDRSAAHEANSKDSILPVESTSSQVNQFGGYTGQNPEQFASFVPAVAAEAGLPVNRILPSRYSSTMQRVAQPFCLVPIVVKQVVFAEFDTRLNHHSNHARRIRTISFLRL